MFKFRYSYQKDQHNGSSDESSKLVAVFSFDDETAPKDRENVRLRLNLDGLLGHYLNEVEKIRISSDGQYYKLTFNESKCCQNYPGEIRFRRHCRGLGITVTIKAQGKLDETNKRLDLEALNHFIKTGERRLHE